MLSSVLLHWNYIHFNFEAHKTKWVP
jgi:hypothetical protein